MKPRNSGQSWPESGPYGARYFLYVRQWQIRYTAISTATFAAGIAFIALTTVLG